MTEITARLDRLFGVAPSPPTTPPCRFFNAPIAATCARPVCGLLVATAESSDALIDGSVNETLRMMRDKFAMDVVFVSEFADGERVLRDVDHSGRGPALPA